VLKERVTRLHLVSNNIRHSSVNFASSKPLCVPHRDATCKHPIGEPFVVIFHFLCHTFPPIPRYHQGEGISVFTGSGSRPDLYRSQCSRPVGRFSLELKQPEREANHSAPSLVQKARILLHAPCTSSWRDVDCCIVIE
jgi:hypothetical protein